MDSWTVNPPSTGPPHGSHADTQLQQPMDGPFSVGSSRVPLLPPSNGAPNHHQEHGFLSVGSGHFGAKPLPILPPELALQHSGAASSSLLLSSGEMMIRCSQMMEILLRQQLQLQLALSAMQSAMAAAPSSSIIEPVHEPQQQGEVMSTTRCDQGPCPRSQSSDPHSSTSTSQQTVSLAPLPLRAPAATEDGPQSAGETASDVTSDAHHLQFQPKPANLTSCNVTEAPASTTAQSATSADVIDQHRKQLHIRPVSDARYDAAQEELDRLKQLKIILEVDSSWPSSANGSLAGASKIGGELVIYAVCQYQLSSPTSKVAANANGSFQLSTSRGPRLHQGKIETFADQLPPWPPPTPAFCSSTHTFNKNRGGREDVQSISNAVFTKKAPQPKSTCVFIYSLIIIPQRKRSFTDPVASLNRQDAQRQHRFQAAAASKPAPATAEQATAPLVHILNNLLSSTSPSPAASQPSTVSSK